MISSESAPTLSTVSAPQSAGRRFGVGMDIVHVPRIRESLANFGDRFVERLYTAGEIADARACTRREAERYAARFAAKEAAIKAYGWSEAGIDWRDIEVLTLAGGTCRLAFHGRAAALAGSCPPASLSLSHDGDYAMAIVVALP